VVIGLEGVLAWLLIGLGGPAVAAYVAWPLRRASRAAPALGAPALDRPWRDAGEARAGALAAIAELDRDHELGKLTADEHARLRDRYERRAAALGRGLDGDPEGGGG
jgi:hypothetical protein